MIYVSGLKCCVYQNKKYTLNQKSKEIGSQGGLDIQANIILNGFYGVW